MVETKAILHVDGDDFFAELARLKQRSCRNRPVVVGYVKSRGTVVASSYEARCSGVFPGITMQQASRICPKAVLVPIDWNQVKKASRAIQNLISRYSPRVEYSAPDAFFVDYTGSRRLFGPAPDFAMRLKKSIQEEMGIKFSVGLSSDKAVSAVACRAAKMGSFENIPIGQEQFFLSGCPLEWLPGIDAGHKKRLNELGIHTIGGLADLPVELMEHIMGSHGRVLLVRARGEENALIRSRYMSCDNETVMEFSEDQILPDEILGKAAILCSRLGSRLRSSHQVTCAVGMVIEYSDDFRISGRCAIEPATDRDPELFCSVKGLFSRLYKRRVRLRRIELSACKKRAKLPELPMGNAVQRIKWDRVFTAVDHVSKRYSSELIQLGASLIGADNQV